MLIFRDFLCVFYIYLSFLCIEKKLSKIFLLAFLIIFVYNKIYKRERKDREVKIKREIEELFFKPIIVSTDDMDELKQKEMKKIRPIKNTWYDWLIIW